MQFLAVDIGGTEVKIGIVDDKGNVLRKTSCSANYDNYETPLLKITLEGARRFVLEAAEEKGVRTSSPQEAAAALELGGIGIATTGMVDKKRGRIAGAAAHIPHFLGSEFKQVFEEAFGLETQVMNDANSAAVAEHWTGSAKGCDNALILTLGTGIGGGIIVGGRILEGAHGYAGEVGHIVIKKDGPMTHSGNHGTYEFYGATKALVHLAEMRFEAAGLPVPEGGLNGRLIFEAVAAGNETAAATVRDWIDDIAVGIVNLIYIFDPEIVVIGGGVSVQLELLIKPLEEAVRRELMPVFAEKLKMVPATHGNDAGMIGAVYGFLQ